MDPIKLGSRGPGVKELQLQLKALGYDVGDIDGIFGKVTLVALMEFQGDVEQLQPTGILDEETTSALRQSLVILDHEATHQAGVPDAPLPCDDETWNAFQGLIETITAAPVRYGPGRGLCRDGRWIVTEGPGALASRKWTSQLGHTYPSFHCSSWTNFFLGWLLRRNEDYTHAGNIPSLFDLCAASGDLHKQTGGSPYRGYGDHCKEIVTDGSTLTRSGQRHAIDLTELLARREQLPTFMVCGQSTRKSGKWRWWHHTVLYVVDHRTPGSPLHRIAADGFHADSGWSGTQMKWTPITEKSLPAFDNIIYRVYGVLTADGSYGEGRPILPITLED
jgi:hypothetical protein